MTAIVPADAATTDRYYTRIAPTPEMIERAEPTVWDSTATAGPLSKDELAAHDRDGFHQVHDLLDNAEIARLASELDRLAADAAVRGDDRCIGEKTSDGVRSIFEVHRLSPLIAQLIADERIAGRAKQILASEVYVHQSRVNYKPGFGGAGFYWHSDFETWHAEDGMPTPRAVSCSISLTDNFAYNGSLMIIPGSHRTFVSCVGETPADHYRSSLREQQIGTPDKASLAALTERHGIALLTGRAGSATFFDSNCMHGSSDNITPFARTNIFVVFNSVENACGEPYYAPARRPEFIGARDFTPVRR